MIKILNLFISLLILTLCFTQYGCRQSESSGNAIEVQVEAENHTSSSSEFEILTLESGDQIVFIPEGGWFAFDISISAAGRYKTQVHMASDPVAGISCWIEDYYDNKDDRQYNISGNMHSPHSAEDELETVFKDGSPLNKGLHKMKFHADSGGARIDWIKFTLLKKHRPTPQILTQNSSGEEWVVAWSDEFDQDGQPDTSKWTYDIGNWGWGNFELQYYTEARPENARIEDGNLIIEARKDDLNEPWTSARLTTRGKTSFLYGKIELRAKVPVQRGNWAAGWTLGDAYIDELSWPYCGEIDIMESVGYETDDETGDGIAHASVHTRAYYFKLGNHHTSVTPVKNMNDEFHTYAVEWLPDGIKAYVDDIQYFTYQDTTDSMTWPFDQPQNIILNLAMGGGWGGLMGMDESVKTQMIIIDYVRVYELK